MRVEFLKDEKVVARFDEFRGLLPRVGETVELTMDRKVGEQEAGTVVAVHHLLYDTSNGTQVVHVMLQD